MLRKILTEIGLLLVAWTGLTTSSPAEVNLTSYLLEVSNPGTRPVENPAEALPVHIDFEIRSILDFDERNQFITVVGWKTLNWMDETLTWDAEEYDGIKRMHFRSNEIWTPDVVLVNAASAPVPIHKTDILISDDGKVKYIQPFIYKSMCITKQHSDVQKCTFEFSSWTYSGQEIDLRMSASVIDVSRFVPHHVWALDITTAKRKEEQYPCCEEKYPKITYTLNLARRPPPINNNNATDNDKKPQNAGSSIYSIYHYSISLSVSLFVFSSSNFLSFDKL